MQSRANILWDQYTKDVTVEAKLYKELLQNYIIPAGFKAQTSVSSSMISLSAVAPELSKEPQQRHLSMISEALNASLKNVDVLDSVLNELKNHHEYEDQAVFCRDEIKPLFDGIRKEGDLLETLVGKENWYLPSYEQMLFKQS